LPIVVPETLDVLNLLKELRRAKGSMVVVSNEFGIIQGLITPLDVLERHERRFSFSEYILNIKMNKFTVSEKSEVGALYCTFTNKCNIFVINILQLTSCQRETFFFFDLWHWVISLFAYAARWSSVYLAYRREGTVYTVRYIGSVLFSCTATLVQ